MTARTLLAPTLPLPRPRRLIAALLALAIIAAAWGLPATLEPRGRMTLAVSALAVLGWVGTRLPESLVALAAVLALVLGGVLSEAQLFAALGSELIWLLLSAFVIAAVARDAGLTQRLVAPLMRRGLRFAPFALLLALLVAATAFVLPSTSGRAALLLPVFAAIAGALPDPALRKPLALLFPTVILLSAGASLIGAGAHLLAAASIRSAVGKSTFSYIITNLNTSPPAPHPKQWNACRAGLMCNDGVFSLWNGHSALATWPVRLTWIYEPMTSAMSSALRIWSIVSLDTMPAMGASILPRGTWARPGTGPRLLRAAAA